MAIFCDARSIDCTNGRKRKDRSHCEMAAGEGTRRETERK